jgi:hypothetical protein
MGTTRKIITALAVLGLVAVPVAVVVWAEATPEEIARLGKDLTPLGAEKAGNADGTIPEWDGGISEPPAGVNYTEGMHHPDPFPDEKPLFTITAANVDQYKDKLSPGQIALLKTYDTYKMKVFPSHRTAAVPQRIYDMTKQVAVTAQLADNGYGVIGAVQGYPFPFPEEGVEVIWNHLLRYRGETASRTFMQAAPTRGGDYTLVQFKEWFLMKYSMANMLEEQLNNRILYFKQEVLAPARLAGGVLLVHEALNQVKEHRSAWLYNPGQRRVRRAPNVAYDNPGTAADGMRTSDQLDMFNGAVDRYNWKLVGKQEMYIPYNSYLLHSNKLKYGDILTPLHINQEYPRYELHRVWVVDATLKEGSRHIYKRRTFYVDEDSWQIAVVDQYDNRDQLWRISEGHAIAYYELPTFWYTLEVHTDLQAGRYLAFGLDNEEPRIYEFDASLSEEDFTPSALRRAGVR